MSRYIKKSENRQAATLAALLCVALTLVAMRTQCHAANELPADKQIADAGKMVPVAVASEPVFSNEPEPEAEPAVEVVALYDVPLDRDLQLFVIEICEAHNIDPAVLLAMMELESGYNASAIGDNGAAFGLLQVQARWHYERMERLECFNLLDPYQNIRVAVDYLSYCIEYNGGNLEMGLMAYNAGQQGATNGWFMYGIYSNDYSRRALTIAENLTEGVIIDVQNG